MITDAILSFFDNIVAGIINFFSLPVVGNLEIPPDAFDGLKKILTNVGYILPVEHYIVMLGFSLSLSSFTVIWALILRVKSFIPTMGR